MKKCVVALILFALVHTGMGQGDLAPSGPPGETMKTLQQVEPRIDVSTLAGDAAAEVVITQSGSSYLSKNLVGYKVDGIRIEATSVTVDLNGFEILNDLGINTAGLRINGAMHRAIVRNGSITGFDYGVYCETSPSWAEACLFEKLTISGCNEYGIRAGSAIRVLDCAIHDGDGNGITAV